MYNEKYKQNDKKNCQVLTFYSAKPPLKKVSFFVCGKLSNAISDDWLNQNAECNIHFVVNSLLF